MDPYGAFQTALPWASFQPPLMAMQPEPLPMIPGYFPEDPTDNPYEFDLPR